ncbi:MAG TPA: PSD1 and planctomycete cytochrome C domain-containing protein [Gemmataceae bacterium]|nr:PSD1 and planctomycete cytochrome C domain-containing protein [Gemmataceae bacterium]
MRASTLFLGLLITHLIASAALAGENAQKQPTKEGIAFFEKHIRPVLVEHCYECHSTEARKVRGKLLLDSRTGIAKGGISGPVIVPGDVEKSRLVQAIRWTDADFAMPPKRKLTPQQIQHFEQWVRMGAPDPRMQASATKSKSLNIEAGRRWWAFAPVTALPAPDVKQRSWLKTTVDAFVLHELEAKQIAPSPRADARTLIQRAYLDLSGLRPSYDEVEAFAKDPSEKAYAAVVERLLASPQYGERWGRYWLDVARYGEDNPTSEATNRPYPFAWRYRDWVIDAINRDVPYDRFVSLQLAGDLMPKTPRSELPATGFLGIGPIYHKDGRLSKDVIENLYMDDWDERVDVVTRGILGLTVACARCHDHKFDPISTRDYYALAGVFASTVAAPRSLAETEPAIEAQFMVNSHRIFQFSYLANLMSSEPGTQPKKARQQVQQFVSELDKIEAEIAPMQEKTPSLHAYLVNLDRRPGMSKQPKSKGKTDERLFHSVFDAGVWVDGSDPDLTTIDVRPGKPRDLHVLPGGNVAKPGDLVPRGFVSVLAKGDAAFQHGSGRRELAERMFSDAGPLAARVIVNRVWGWHFGKPLVDTPSDFGIQGDRPTHPQLLDDLAARFIAHGWSLKWLHREIMLSATYQQASRMRAEPAKVDPSNRLLWRMNPRRLDIEAYRDCILQAAGTLDTKLGGPSSDLDQLGNKRRTVYARISRGRLNNLLQQFGFPEATMHSPNREANTTPLQQLFVLNSPFMRDQSAAFAATVTKEADVDAKVRDFYRRLLARDPSEREAALGRTYLRTGSMTDYAQALICINEVIYWP